MVLYAYLKKKESQCPLKSEKNKYLCFLLEQSVKKTSAFLALKQIAYTIEWLEFNLLHIHFYFNNFPF